MTGKIKYKFFFESENLETYCSDYVLDASGYAEVFPQYDDEFGIKWEREQDQIFFRKQIDGELTFACFNGIRDYNCLHYLPIDEEVYLHIYSSCDNYVKPIYSGYFTRRNIFWDENERIAVIDNIIPYDKYSCILRNWETEYNITNRGIPFVLENRHVDRFIVAPATLEQFEYCKKIKDVINYLIGEEQWYSYAMPCELEYKSTFFENDLTVDTDNYVTGEEPNPLNDIMIADKSDILAEADCGDAAGHPRVFNEAIISNISLKTLLNILKHLYDIRWHIDSDGYFRVEHISFYTNALGILPLNDLTILKNKYTDKEYAYHTEKYDYLDLPDREEFIYSEKGSDNPLEGNPDFEDYFIDYTYSNQSPGGTKNTKEVINHTISGFTNDLDWMCEFCDSPGNDGFVILQVVLAAADRWTVDKPNIGLSWASLINNYWQDRRPFIYGIKGFIKDAIISWLVDIFDSKRRSKKQIPIEIHGCCDPFDDDFDIFDLIKTWLGNGEIYNFRYTLSSGAVTVELLYEAEDIEEPVLPEE